MGKQDSKFMLKDRLQTSVDEISSPAKIFEFIDKVAHKRMKWKRKWQQSEVISA